MSARRILHLAIAALLLVVGVGLFWLTSTEGGLRFAWGLVQERLQLPIQGEVHGKLMGPLRVEGFSLDLPRTRIDAASAEFDWQPWGLLEGRLLFTRTEVRELAVTIKPRPPTASNTPPRILGPRLPVEVRGKVEGLAVLWGEDRQVRFDQVALSGVVGPRELSFDALDLQGYGARLEASGKAELRLDGPVDLETRWSWRPPQGEEIRGHGVLKGTLARLETEQVLEAVLRGSARGSLTWIDQPVRWQAEIDTGPVDIAQLHGPLRPLQVQGRLRGEGGAGELRLDARGEMQDAALGSWRFTGDAVRETGGWRLPSLRLEAADGPGRLMASGLLRTAGATAVDLDVAWSEVAFPLNGSARWFVTPRGRVAVEGTLESYAIDGTAALARPGVPDGEVNLAGRGNRSGLEVTRLRAAWLDGELAGTGRLQWKPFFAWQAEVQASGVDPGKWQEGWPGRLAARVVTEGARRDDKLQARVELHDLGGQLRGRTLAGSGRFFWNDGLLRLEALALQSGSASLKAQGDAGRRWALEWSVDAPRIEDLVPGLAGQVQAKGALQGQRERPRLLATGTAANLSWKERRAGQLSLDADMDLAGETPWNLRLAAQQVTLTERMTLQGLTATAEGGPADHQLVFDAATEGRTLRVQARGAYAEGRWRGELADGRIEDALLGTWTQAAPAPLTVSPAEVRLGRGCWESGEASLCLAGEGGAGLEWRGKAELRAFPMAAMRRFVDRGFQVTGVVNGEGAFAYREGLTALDLELAATRGEFRFQLSGGDAIATPYRRLEVRAGSVEGKGGEALALLELENGDHARVELALPRWVAGQPFDEDQPLRGTVEASLGELVWLSLLMPDVVATGRLEGRFAVGGTVGEPILQGKAVLADGQVAIPLLGISLADLSIETGAAGPRGMDLRARARSGKGQMEVSGRLDRPAAGWTLALNLKGENLEVVRLPQAHVLASPDLQVQIRDRVIDLRGSLRVPKAEIDMPEIEAPVQPSPDVIIVDRQESVETRRRWTVTSEVEVRFGDEVRLSGYGFEGRLGGQILVLEPAGGGAIGRGEIQVLDGKYSAYGQALTIEEGRLLYGNAPLNNPGIEFRAVRQVEEVKVGILATGRLKQPEVRLYSEPAMEETRVLAFLVLGRPLETATQEEANTLQQTALSLGLVGGTEVARQLAGEAGIDVVDVQSNGTQAQPSLVLGKYLSPRLYIQYAIGFWEAGNAWQMRYLLDDNWTLKAESGLQSGGDLLYTIEK